MKQETSFRYILRLTLTLLTICAVVAALLGGVNAITRDRIAQAKEEKTLKAMQQVLPGVENLQKMSLSGDTGIITCVYASGNSYAVEVTPSGFDSVITMMVGISDGKVTGISIISHSETPGLGAVAAADNAKGEAFRNQFIGLTQGIVLDGTDNAVDAMSGATITSRAVVAGVNAALDFVASLG